MQETQALKFWMIKTALEGAVSPLWQFLPEEEGRQTLFSLTVPRKSVWEEGSWGSKVLGGLVSRQSSLTALVVGLVSRESRMYREINSCQIRGENRTIPGSVWGHWEGNEMEQRISSLVSAKPKMYVSTNSLAYSEIGVQGVTKRHSVQGIDLLGESMGEPRALCGLFLTWVTVLTGTRHAQSSTAF